jgi:hypothetical protein
MNVKQKTKIAFLIAAIAMFTLTPVYYFIMTEGEGWIRWLPPLLFLVVGILFLVNYFIIQMEQARSIDAE